jgi:hypothetical protein
MHYRYYEHDVGRDELGIEKNRGAFEADQGPEGAVPPYRDA